MNIHKIQNIVTRFFNPDEIAVIESIENGLINDTLFLKSNMPDNDFVLQKINRKVFREPEKVMRNLVLIHQTIKSTHDTTYQLPELIPDKNGNLYYIDENNDFWRVFTFVQNSKMVELIEHPTQAYEAAKSFGNFVKNLVSLDVSLLDETIYRFHDYRNRFNVFEEAIEINELNRVDTCQAEIDQIYERSEYIDTFYSKELPIRTVHGDAKIHNVLFNQDSDKAIAVIDLDIAMPASILYDYGEMVRSFTNSSSEDDPDTSGIRIDKEIFSQLTHGFLSETSEILSKNERENLLLGPKLIIYIQSIRFLTDFLLGDIYYKTEYNLHNLVRTGNQLALLKQIEQNDSELQAIINRQLAIHL